MTASRLNFFGDTMAKLELKIDSREVWAAYADRLYSGDKVSKSVTEMLQNSVDAGSSEIRISLSKNEEKQWVLSFADDGCGMTPDVFLNRFLCLGGKGESTGDRTGGNGVAKAVILFNRYVADFKIHSTSEGRSFTVTQNDILSGGELVEVPEKMTTRHGVTFEITYKSDAYIYPETIKPLLAFARPTRRTKIVFNNEIVRPCGQISHFHTDLAGYPVYKYQGDNYGGYIIILSNGLPQFTEYTGAEGTYLIDFTSTTFRDFTPSRERLANEILEKTLRRLKDRVHYEHENPVSAKTPPQKVQKRFAYNFRKNKAKKEPKEKFVFMQPEGPLPTMEHNLPVLEDDRRAALVSSGSQSIIEDSTANAHDALAELVPLRGVIFEDRSSKLRKEWHPEKLARFRKLLVLMDRYIEIFETEHDDLEVANIGFMKNSGYHEAIWSSDEKAVLIDISKLDKKFSVAALQIANHLSHELAHRWEHSHNENFALRQARLLNTMAVRAKDFAAIRREIRKVK